ncbi:MAG: hypothetical protein IKQ71_01895 [Lachnospiraceae bacterium]|nr:hypothetical protein [Lachnospiraceae bacterium]
MDKKYKIIVVIILGAFVFMSGMLRHYENRYEKTDKESDNITESISEQNDNFMDTLNADIERNEKEGNIFAQGDKVKFGNFEYTLKESKIFKTYDSLMESVEDYDKRGEKIDAIPKQIDNTYYLKMVFDITNPAKSDTEFDYFKVGIALSEKEKKSDRITGHPEYYYSVDEPLYVGGDFRYVEDKNTDSYDLIIPSETTLKVTMLYEISVLDEVRCNNQRQRILDEGGIKAIEKEFNVSDYYVPIQEVYNLPPDIYVRIAGNLDVGNLIDDYSKDSLERYILCDIEGMDMIYE